MKGIPIWPQTELCRCHPCGREGAALAGTRPGRSCLITVASDLAITGKIDRRSIPIDARNHQVTLSGRGITRNPVDCSAVADLGIAIPSFQVKLGETPYQIIKGVARYAGYLVNQDVFGRLVLHRIGTSLHASGVTLPGNVEAIKGERSVDGRFSTYVVVTSGVEPIGFMVGLGVCRAEPRACQRGHVPTLPHRHANRPRAPGSPPAAKPTDAREHNGADDASFVHSLFIIPE